MLQIKKMRLPTCAEYDALATAAKENNGIMHWDSIFSWCQDADPNWASYRAVRGYYSARYWSYYSAANQVVRTGFRPVFEALGPNVLGPNGTTVPVATLYMDGQPVKVPQNPTQHGDIPDYIPGSKLEFRAPLDDPDYQVLAIKVGDILIADRALLTNISWNDLHEQGFC